MSGYRFCRTDDVPLLVEAYNRCYRPHFPEEAPLDVDEFKRRIRELDLWTSSCMVAFSGDDLIGVLLAGKRKTESLIHRIAIHPDHVGRSHGSHLLQSLAQKLAILRPSRIVVELPEEASRWRAFFEKAGFRLEGPYDDLAVEGRGRIAPAAEPVTFSELEEAAVFENPPRTSWNRNTEALGRRASTLRGWAILSEVRIEAFLLASGDEGGPTSIERLGHADSPEGVRSLTALLRSVAEASRGTVRIPRVSPEELPVAVAEACGFRRERRFVGYALEAAALE